MPEAIGRKAMAAQFGGSFVPAARAVDTAQAPASTKQAITPTLAEILMDSLLLTLGRESSFRLAAPVH
jgi:hypothetical protein